MLKRLASALCVWQSQVGSLWSPGIFNLCFLRILIHMSENQSGAVDRVMVWGSGDLGSNPFLAMATHWGMAMANHLNIPWKPCWDCYTLDATWWYNKWMWSIPPMDSGGSPFQTRHSNCRGWWKLDRKVSSFHLLIQCSLSCLNRTKLSSTAVSKLSSSGIGDSRPALVMTRQASADSFQCTWAKQLNLS